MTFIGIDPGQSGGIGVINGAGSYVDKMPDTERDLFNYLVSVVAQSSCGLRGECEIIAFIEQVHSMPRQGVASSFKFGMSYGMLRMALICTGIPFESVTPQKWQKELQCLSKGDKNVTKKRAQELFPQLKITHATADAILLAEYARRTRK